MTINLSTKVNFLYFKFFGFEIKCILTHCKKPFSAYVKDNPGLF